MLTALTGLVFDKLLDSSIIVVVTPLTAIIFIGCYVILREVNRAASNFSLGCGFANYSVTPVNIMAGFRKCGTKPWCYT